MQRILAIHKNNTTLQHKSNNQQYVRIHTTTSTNISCKPENKAVPNIKQLPLYRWGIYRRELKKFRNSKKIINKVSNRQT
jgi:hypothetical protein